MTHTAGVASAIRQLHPQFSSPQWEPFAQTERRALTITGPEAGRTPSTALGRVNTRILGKAKPWELALWAHHELPVGSLDLHTGKADLVGSLPIDLSREDLPRRESLARSVQAVLAQRRLRGESAEVALKPGSMPPAMLKTLQRLNLPDMRLER